jgi:hypothetical protein
VAAGAQTQLEGAEYKHALVFFLFFDTTHAERAANPSEGVFG